ncbi:MAG: hypothetical protein KDA73_19735 [Rhodobacteraceae bacterium]|nr:hypothetical protein [Paracoccaceae bacterium]
MTTTPEAPRYLTQRDLEARWKLCGRTLERWRKERYGPPWAVLGGAIRYLESDIETFEAGQRRGTRCAQPGEKEGQT